MKECWIKPFISGFGPNPIEHWAPTGRPHCLLQPYSCVHSSEGKICNLNKLLNKNFCPYKGPYNFTNQCMNFYNAIGFTNFTRQDIPALMFFVCVFIFKSWSCQINAWIFIMLLGLLTSHAKIFLHSCFFCFFFSSSKAEAQTQGLNFFVLIFKGLAWLNNFSRFDRGSGSARRFKIWTGLELRAKIRH